LGALSRTSPRGGTFEQAAQMIVKAFLMSPSFITKGELSEASPQNTMDTSDVNKGITNPGELTALKA
jgi:hypothetical protein